MANNFYRALDSVLDKTDYVAYKIKDAIYVNDQCRVRPRVYFYPFDGEPFVYWLPWDEIPDSVSDAFVGIVVTTITDAPRINKNL